MIEMKMFEMRIKPDLAFLKVVHSGLHISINGNFYFRPRLTGISDVTNLQKR